MGGVLSFLRRNPEQEPQGPHEMRLAVCFGYIDTGIRDSTENKRPEDAALDALFDTGIIPTELRHNFNSFAWKTAVKMEKGAHAAAQVASVKVTCETNGITNLLNSVAPQFLKFWGAVEAEERFDASRMCEIQNFLYVLPLSVLDKASLDVLEEVAIPAFLGEHDFHNFTHDVPTTRLIYSVRVCDVVERDGVKFIPFYFSGKNWARGQIRRIMTVFILFALRVMTIDQLRSTLGHRVWKIPKAPVDFLVLDSVGYPFYMRRMRKPDPKRADVEFKNMRPEIELWKYEVVLGEMAREVRENNVFQAWVKRKLHKGTAMEEGE